MKRNPESLNTDTRENPSAMKIVGLSCGRRNGNSEMLLKEACRGAQEAGAETEILRLHEHYIKPCTGCQNCTLSMSKGEKEVECVIKDDDVPGLLRKILCEDCALILSSPAYFLTVPGLLKMLNDRFTPYMVHAMERFKAKRRVGANIAVGGGEPWWTPLGLFFQSLFMAPHRFLVDQIQVNYAGRRGMVVLHEEALPRARKLGRNVAEAMKMADEDVKFMGDEADVSCPLCHTNVLQVTGQLPKVVCPICSIEGTIAVEAEKMVVTWDGEGNEPTRWGAQGMAEHFETLTERIAEYEKQKDKVGAGIEKHKNLDIRILRPGH